MPTKNSPRSKKAAVTTQRRLEALGLRAKGMNFEQIGGALGISKEAAWQLVNNAMKDHLAATKEATDALREISLLQVDAIILTHLETATNNLSLTSDKSAMVVLKAIAERAKLTGLYAPQKQEITGRDGAPVAGVGVVAGVDLSALSAEQLERLHAIMQAATPSGGVSGPVVG